MPFIVDLPPTVRVAIAGWRAQATQMDAVAKDLERAGIVAEFTRGQAAALREFADEFEASEYARAGVA